MTTPLEMLNDCFQLAENFLRDEKSTERFTWLSPSELSGRLSLELGSEGVAWSEVRRELEAILKVTPATGGPRFWNQLYGGKSLVAIGAEVIAAATNNSLYTYKVGGPFVLIEKVLLSKMLSLIEFEGGEGSFTPGGSLSNFLGLLLARDARLPGVLEDGLRSPVSIYASQECHYSIVKAVRFLGFGERALRLIPANGEGAMNIETLRKTISADRKNGVTPLAVVATAGTTVLGSFDSLPQIRSVCNDEGMWMHVDGAYGGSLALSPQQRYRLEGLDEADSFTWDAHKLLGVPLTCSALLTRHPGLLSRSLVAPASYLFQRDDGFNPGETSLQCGRKNDPFKLWLLWKYYGDAGLAKRVDWLFELASYAEEHIAEKPGLRLYRPRQSLNLCFQVEGHDPRLLCERLDNEGVLKVSFALVDREPVIRLCLVNPEATKTDVDFFFSELELFLR